MDFRTKIKIAETDGPKIGYTSNVFGIGSCFVENIGSKLEYFKFQNCINPFGIVYNPISIANQIERIVEKKYFEEKDIFQLNDQWQSFDLHSKLNTSDENNFLQAVNAEIDDAYDNLKSATHFIITLGTAWVYEINQTGEIVANCHKVPQKNFTKRLLSVEEIEESFKKLKSSLARINNSLSIICTISPVRHLKDGFVENNLSKSHLIAATSKAVDNYANWFYFPSYEIMMDDLRDYRFYADDLLHPNNLAVDYIWEHFLVTWIDSKAESIMKKVDSIRKRKNHRPLNSHTQKHREFLKNLETDMQALNQSLPHINFH